MPVIYVCCFASVTRKHANATQFMVRTEKGSVIYVYTTKLECDVSIHSKVVRGSQKFRFGVT